MTPLKDILAYAVILFVILSAFLLVQHEVALMRHGTPPTDPSANLGKHKLHDIFAARIAAKELASKKSTDKEAVLAPIPPTISFRKDSKEAVVHELAAEHLQQVRANQEEKEVAGADAQDLEQKELEIDAEEQEQEAEQFTEERKGVLMCNGSRLDSEVIYWRIVPGDNEYESPITPHHKEHHDKYLTFEYDAGGWNNIRMGMECLLVVAHAMGRTLVVPPQQHLYLLGQTHKDKGDKEAHDEMGFEDFFDLDLLRSHEVGTIFVQFKVLLRRACMIALSHGSGALQ
jgi:hypothetical protein